MTELEMSRTLGILADPEHNRIHLEPDMASDLMMVTLAFHEMRTQRRYIGTLNQDLWLEFLPWHSLN